MMPIGDKEYGFTDCVISQNGYGMHVEWIF